MKYLKQILLSITLLIVAPAFSQTAHDWQNVLKLVPVKIDNMGKFTKVSLGDICMLAIDEDGNLWSYHSMRDRFNKVFSFDEPESDGFRESIGEYDIKIISVDKNGNIYFLVY